MAIDMLEQMGANSSQLKPLNRLSEALIDLNSGTVAPMLKHVKSKGRSPDTYEYNLFKAHAVAVMDILMNGGWAERDASAFVARKLLNMNYPVTKQTGASPAGSVQNWRKDIDINPAKERRDFLVREFEQREGPPQAKAELLLSQFPGIVPVPNKADPEEADPKTPVPKS